jgi:Fe-S-cluster-containing hydrogenase component 2
MLRCKQELPYSAFRFKNKSRGVYQSLCIQCNKIYQKEHYQKNKKQYMLLLSERKIKIKRKLSTLKESLPCTDCGGFFMACQMDFDHISGDKTDNISQMAHRTYSWQSIKDEIEKCELVCANCHRKRTYLRYKNVDYVFE